MKIEKIKTNPYNFNRMTTEEIEISEYEASRIEKLRRQKEARKLRRRSKQIPTLLNISENQPVQTKEELKIYFPELDSRDIELLLDLSTNGSEGDTYCRKNLGVRTIFRVNEERRIEKVSRRLDMTEGDINKYIMREFQNPSVCHKCKGSLDSGYVEWSSNRYCRECGSKKVLTFFDKIDKELPCAEKNRLTHEAVKLGIRKLQRKKK